VSQFRPLFYYSLSKLEEERRKSRVFIKNIGLKLNFNLFLFHQQQTLSSESYLAILCVGDLA